MTVSFFGICRTFELMSCPLFATSFWLARGVVVYEVRRRKEDPQHRRTALIQAFSIQSPRVPCRELSCSPALLLHEMTKGAR